jgi:Kef-type K+ transport system membrane component KefB
LVIPVDWAYRKAFVARVEDVAGVLLLPVFFVITGLRTEIGALRDGSDWLVCGLIIIAAVAGKLGGGALAARFTGESWRDAFALGALMNTRGLMQLIVLNIGYDLGILSPAIFTMMIVMAMVTTAMTGPLLRKLAN